MEEIENYIKQHSDNHLYPAFSIKIDNQWYMGVGNLNSALGRLFPCDETYAGVGRLFLREV